AAAGRLVVAEWLVRSIVCSLVVLAGVAVGFASLVWWLASDWAAPARPTRRRTPGDVAGRLERPRASARLRDARGPWNASGLHPRAPPPRCAAGGWRCAVAPRSGGWHPGPAVSWMHCGSMPASHASRRLARCRPGRDPRMAPGRFQGLAGRHVWHACRTVAA